MRQRSQMSATIRLVTARLSALGQVLRRATAAAKFLAATGAVALMGVTAAIGVHLEVILPALAATLTAIGVAWVFARNPLVRAVQVAAFVASFAWFLGELAG